jgi:hypothetical protein
LPILPFKSIKYAFVILTRRYLLRIIRHFGTLSSVGI